MPWLGGLLAGGGSALSGLFGFLGSGNAANAQVKAEQQSIAFNEAVLEAIAGRLDPWLTAGTSALGNLSNMLGMTNAGPGYGLLLENPAQLANIGAAPTYNMPTPTTTTYQQSPGYEFQMQQGTQAIQNSAAGKQGAISGNTLQQLGQYGQGLANQDWWQWLNNYQNNYNTQYNAQNQQYWQQYGAAANYQNNLYNMFTNLANSGQQAAVGQGAPVGQLTNSITSGLTGIGNAQAGGILGQTGAINNSLSSFLTQLLGNNYGNGSTLSNLQYGQYFNPDYYNQILDSSDPFGNY